ncbi:putative AraC-type transcription regulator [Novosphingobium sp. Rr 2-17]|uniref:helix-turn-helix domain-containing protein n=1 Tax=Novosphingobium sp. Rr 2-17 TaxID=555793 RepID=UPI0002697EDA|nr:AraC family transcriptional regulator [Novosphingobium sp. Rr 2-17]EIZ78351.1 putative AraC-type transcription regulator [Novosphingobium sp. Rr 2-17]
MMASAKGQAFTAGQTHGILLRPEHRIARSSDELGWRSLYASHQFERPYRDRYEACDDHLVIVHLTGPARVERDLSGDKAKRRIGKGGLFLLPAGRDFGVELMDPLETVHLYVRRSLLLAAAAELCKGDPARVEFMPRLGEHDPLIEQLGRSAVTMMVDRQSDFFADGAARLLAAQLVRCHSTGTSLPDDRREGLTRRQLVAVDDLIEAQMEQPLRIEDLAAAAGLGAFQFARQFKRATGRTPHQHVIEQRLARARELLRGDLAIAEIAYRCGFSSQEHLTRLFGRQQGATPAAYRRALRN